MSIALGSGGDGATAGLKTIPARSVVTLLRRQGAVNTLEAIGQETQGAITRVNLGPFRPYLITHPSHVHHVMRVNAANYPRGAMMWEAMSRLVGQGIAGEGPEWRISRDILHTTFSSQYIQALANQLADTIASGVEDLLSRASDVPMDAGLEMMRLVHRVVSLAFFANRISADDSDRLGAAISTAMSSIGWRMAMPFLPYTLPLPGDRAFKRAARTVEQTLQPIIDAGRKQPLENHDVVTLLANGRGADGASLSDKRIREDIVSLYVAGSESSMVALSWLWVAIHNNPTVARRLYAEVDNVVGKGPARPEHIRQLNYLQMVLQEVLRLYSPGWAVPRMALEDDDIDGIPIRAGSTLVISPYLTHRLEAVWDHPRTFVPERFTSDAIKARALRYGRCAYMPFGTGEHGCLGERLFKLEATLIVASLLARTRPKLVNAGNLRPHLALTLRPRQPLLFILKKRTLGSLHA